ncbi:MAG TPA: hypothetical protein VLF91_02090 [Candidatus Saccharimonadales bacterium]|nr:hypothetical protein [Candidatus Saccharimonadales bacterium]
MSYEYGPEKPKDKEDKPAKKPVPLPRTLASHVQLGPGEGYFLFPHEAEQKPKDAEPKLNASGLLRAFRNETRELEKKQAYHHVEPLTPGLSPAEAAPPARPPHAAAVEQQQAAVLAESKKKEEDDKKDDDDAPSSRPAPPLNPRPAAETAPKKTLVDILDELVPSTRADAEAPAQVPAEAAVTESQPVETTEAFGAEDLPPVPSPLPPRFENLAPFAPIPPMSRPFTEAPPPPPAGGGRPPMPPVGPPPEAIGRPGPEPEPLPDAPETRSFPLFGGAAESFRTTLIPAFERPVDQQAVNEAAYQAEKRGLRRGLLVGFVVGVILRNRKIRRLEKTHTQQAKQQNQRINQLESQQTILERQYASAREQLSQRTQRYDQLPQQPSSRFEAPSPPPRPIEAPRPKVATPEQPLLKPEAELTPEQAAQAAVEQAYKLQAGQHVEHSSWHNIIVDERGHEVQEAMQYGKAFEQERHREQQPVAVSAAADAQAVGQAAVGSGVPGLPTGLGNPMFNLPSGQLPPSHQLPGGMGTPGHPQGQLPVRPQSQLVEAFTSPWLWAGLVVLLIAFFAAAFL